jgi:MFS family permease
LLIGGTLVRCVLALFLHDFTDIPQLHTFGLMMASLSKKYYQFILSQGLCSGIGTAMLLYPAVSCVASWFHKKRATALGAASAGAGIGGVLYPIIVREGLQNIGFGWTMRTCAFVTLFLGVVTCVTSTSRVPPTPKKSTVQDLKAAFQDIVYDLVVAAGSTGFIGLFVV